jgi:hypothetical protein
MLSEGVMSEAPHVAEQQTLVDICIKVVELGKFKSSDLERNKIEEITTDPPAFVTDFVRMLDRKPIILPVRCFVDLSVCCSILTGQCRVISQN